MTQVFEQEKSVKPLGFPLRKRKAIPPIRQMESFDAIPFSFFG